MRLVFVITALHSGGAEMMLWKLLSRIDRGRFEPFVIALSRESDRIVQSFGDIDVPCELLGMRPGRGSLGAVFQLAGRLRRLAPDIVQGWMYHGNIAATVASMLLGRKVPVLWNIRGALDSSHNRRPTGFVIWAGGKLSRTAARIINNSTVSALQHEQHFGYQSSKRVVLPNGFDTDVFRPNAQAREIMRRALQLPSDALLVGLIGHYRSMKDHPGFVRAARLLNRRYPQTHYVLVGDRIDSANVELNALIAAGGLGERMHLLGQRSDMHSIEAALDIAVSSSSSGEGFPNVIGEAMSCGVPCVVTDVGDSPVVVGDTGTVVPPLDPEALANAIAQLIDGGEAQRRELGARARQRIVDHFSLDAVVRQYETLYTAVHAEFSAQRGV